MKCTIGEIEEQSTERLQRKGQMGEEKLQEGQNKRADKSTALFSQRRLRK